MQVGNEVQRFVLSLLRKLNRGENGTQQVAQVRAAAALDAGKDSSHGFSTVNLYKVSNCRPNPENRCCFWPVFQKIGKNSLPQVLVEQGAYFRRAAHHHQVLPALHQVHPGG